MSQESRKTLKDFYISHNGYIDNNRMHLSCLCDSTQIFAVKMTEFLELFGCTDIKVHGEQINDSVYGYKYEASGLLKSNG